MPHRLRPILNAFLDQLPTLLLATPLAFIWAWIEHALGIYKELLTMNAYLAYFAIRLLLINTAYGLWMSLVRRREGFLGEKGRQVLRQGDEIRDYGRGLYHDRKRLDRGASARPGALAPR